MAFSFNGTNQSISSASAAVTAAPATLAAWFYPNNTTAEMAVLTVGSSSTNDWFGVEIVGSDAGDPLKAYSRSTSAANGSNVNGFVANTWQFGAGAFESAISRIGYLDNTKGTANTTNVVPLSLDGTAIGQVPRSVAQYWLNGRAAEAAIWSAALTDDEITSLSKGFKPSRIRPQSLVFYAPLIRNLQDTKGGLALTNNNSATVADHPRVY